MTKQFEETRRGTVAELRAYYEEHPARGEVVIVLGGAPTRTVGEAEIRQRVRALRDTGMSAKDTASAVAKELGVSRRVAYQLTQEKE
jgi:16S rRNA (cytidine1402-2'-O)-methyltransferase